MHILGTHDDATRAQWTARRPGPVNGDAHNARSRTASSTRATRRCPGLGDAAAPHAGQ